MNTSRSNRFRLIPFGPLALAVLMVASLLISASPASAQDDPPPDPPPAEPSLVWGAHPQPLPGQSRVDAATDLQTALGFQVPIMRRYLLWEDDPTVDPLVTFTLAQGSTPFISLKSQRPDGSPVLWRDIADAEPGTPIHDDLLAWAARIQALNTPIWFSFHHEPEIVENQKFGTSADYVDAWRRVREVFDAEGATDVTYAWVMTSYAFTRGPEDRRHAPLWYPGDDVVDHIGADSYNWYDCRIHIVNQWRSLETTMAAARDFAALHPDKGLLIAEFGSAEEAGDPGRKAQWVEDVARMIRKPEWSQLSGIMSFHSDHPQQADSECDWWVDSSPESLAAYQSLYNDPLFGGDGEPPGPVGPGEPGTCLATLSADGAVEVSWGPVDGFVVVRRNNAYLSSPPKNPPLFVDTNPPVGVVSYKVRNWVGNSFNDIDCGTVTIEDDTPAFGCLAVLDGDDVTVTWDDTPAAEILRRNDAWLSSPSADTTSFVDAPAAAGDYSYSLRVWAAGGAVDTDCGTVTVDGPPPVELTCTAVADGFEVTLTWSDTPEQELIRRNGGWRASPSSDTTSFIDRPGAGDHEYSLRLWPGPVDVDCGTVTVGEAPPAVCTITQVGEDVQIDWSGFFGTVVVRRNGFWLTTPAADVSTYTDVAAPADAVYTIRQWLAGTPVDTPCEL